VPALSGMRSWPAPADNAFVRRSVLLVVLAACLFATGDVEGKATGGPSLAAARAAVELRIHDDYGTGQLVGLDCTDLDAAGTRTCSFLQIPSPTGTGESKAGSYTVRFDRAGRLRLAPTGNSCWGNTCYFTGGPSGEIEIVEP